MGQQPNPETIATQPPRTELEPGPAARWRPIKPGLITHPDAVPSFAHTGPDSGWGLRLLSKVDLPDESPRLKAVVAALAMARAAALGRGPVVEDIDAALALCGYGFDAPQAVLDRRQQWLDAVPHETRPGSSAVESVGREILALKPEQIRQQLS